MCKLPSLQQIQIWGVVLVLVMLVTACDNGSSTPTPPSAAGPSAAVIAVSGPAFACAQTTGCATPATLGAQVFTNGEARTDAGATANLQTTSTVFRLEERATIQFKAVTDAITQITLAGGRVFVNHTGNKDQITIQAGDVRVDTLDTKITLVMSDTAIYVGVPDGGGRAKVTLSNGQTGTLPESFTYTIPTGAQQLPPQVLMDALEQGRWDHFSPELQPTPFVPTTSTPVPTGRIAPDTAGQVHLVRSLEPSPLTTLAVSPDGQTLAEASAEGGSPAVRLRQVADGKVVRELAGLIGGPTNSVAYAPDGATVAAGQGTHLLLWRAGDWTLHDLGDQQVTVLSVVFAPDGQTLAVGTEDGIVRLWQVKEERLLRLLTQHNFAVRSMAISPDQQILASASDDETIHLSPLTEATGARTLNVAAASVAFTPNGVLLAAGCSDGLVRLWRASDGTLQHTWGDPGPSISSIAFTPDGELLATGNLAGTITLWRMSDGTTVRTLHGQGAIKTVAFSPTGQLLFSAGLDNVIQLWGTAESGTPSP